LCFLHGFLCLFDLLCISNIRTYQIIIFHQGEYVPTKKANPTAISKPRISRSKALPEKTVNEDIGGENMVDDETLTASHLDSEVTDVQTEETDSPLEAVKSPSSPKVAAHPSALKARTEKPETHQLTVNLSQSLMKRLQYTAMKEGVSVDDFVSELLAEGVVLRAWEIMEKKTTMRQGNAGAPNHPNQRNQPRPGNNNFRGGGGNNFNRTGRQGQPPRKNFKNIMEDSASFLEYVRSQEKKKK
jgi:hypothetical protein